MAEEGEEAQGVQGLLSPGRKVSETPTAVKAMEGGGCFWRGLQGVCQYCGSAPSIQWHVLCTRVDSCAAEVKEALSFIFLRCSSYEFILQQVFLGIQGFNF